MKRKDMFPNIYMYILKFIYFLEVIGDLPFDNTSPAVASSGQPLEPSSLANGMAAVGILSERDQVK